MNSIYPSYDAMPFDERTISRNDLNITEKTKTNPLPWNGQFNPQLVEILFSNYCRKDDIIFDPFLGSGTTIFEAGKLNLQSCGSEINYGAVCLASVYKFINIPLEKRKCILNRIESNFLFMEDCGKDFFKNLIAATTNAYELILLRSYIVLLDFYKNNFTEKWTLSKWQKIKNLVLALPYSEKAIQITQEDVRFSKLSDNSCSFVLTSPPYINVFNYHQQYRASVEFLNGSVLPAAKAEIGSNRKNRGNRYLTVIDYCEDMAKVFSEINRICKKDSHIIFVVGRESSVMKTPFYNGKIIAELACKVCGLKPLFRQERNFKNKFGKEIYEDILHFSSTKSDINKNALTNFIINLLSYSLQYAPLDKRIFLTTALENFKLTVQPYNFNTKIFDAVIKKEVVNA